MAVQVSTARPKSVCTASRITLNAWRKYSKHSKYELQDEYQGHTHPTATSPVTCIYCSPHPPPPPHPWHRATRRHHAPSLPRRQAQRHVSCAFPASPPLLLAARAIQPAAGRTLRKTSQVRTSTKTYQGEENKGMRVGRRGQSRDDETRRENRREKNRGIQIRGEERREPGKSREG